MSGPSAFPLSWPVGEPRALLRERGSFKVTLSRARAHLSGELRRMGARDVVISSNIPLRLDGEIRSGFSGNLHDPGVAVYWWTFDDRNQRRSFAMACDRFFAIESNFRAIGKTIEALRTIERHATRQLRDRAMTGFAALPANAGPPQRTWREVLGFNPGEAAVAGWIEDAYRSRARRAHPDAGGSTADMAELNRARAEALAEIERA